MSNLKQGTLSFATVKRTNSAPNGKLQEKTAVAEKARAKTKQQDISLETQKASNHVVEISSDEGDAAPAEVTVPAKRMRAKAQSFDRTIKRAPSQPLQPEKQKHSPAAIEREHLDVEDKAGRYRRYYNEVRSKMGHIPPVHSEGQNKIYQMLRFFDMSYEYGPCIGMTRLERWERAEAFGFNPPVEVRDILLTKEGVEKEEYAQSVLYGEV
ncbi:DNA polymerase delta, subunit 4-domain-containing protein [Chiua virens]|nr:DNA polymerase delta, subunit 4-domain-containing protein [Chiua virens]